MGRDLKVCHHRICRPIEKAKDTTERQRGVQSNTRDDRGFGKLIQDKELEVVVIGIESFSSLKLYGE